MSNDSWTAADVVAASNEWVWIPEGSREVRTDDYLLVAAEEFIPSPTSVFVTGSRAQAADLVDEIVDVARNLGRTRTWWHVSDATRPPELEAESRPPRRGARRPASTCSDCPSGPACPTSPCRRTSSAPGGRRGDGARRLTRQRRGVRGRRVSERVAWSLRELQRGARGRPVGRVVSYVDGQPAGTGGWTLAGPVCRLWGGATHSALRGRGAYRAALATRLEIARAAGATLGLSHGGVETSAPILARLGFARYGETRGPLLDASMCATESERSGSSPTPTAG